MCEVCQYAGAIGVVKDYLEKDGPMLPWLENTKNLGAMAVAAIVGGGLV